MKAKEFDQAFDEGQNSIDEHIDWSSAQRPGLETRRINIDFPEWMITDLDREAARRLSENSARSEDGRKLRIKIPFCEVNSGSIYRTKRNF